MNAWEQAEIVRDVLPPIETSVEAIRRRLPALRKEVESLIKVAEEAESEIESRLYVCDEGYREKPMILTMYQLRTGLENFLEDVINEVYRDTDWED